MNLSAEKQAIEFFIAKNLTLVVLKTWGKC